MIRFGRNEIAAYLHRTLNEFLRWKADKNIETISYGYQERYKGRLRWVSAKGEPANRREGLMQRSIKKSRIGNTLLLSAGGPIAPYTKHVEMGSKNRPNLKSIIRKNMPQIKRVTKASIVNILREKIHASNRGRS